MTRDDLDAALLALEGLADALRGRLSSFAADMLVNGASMDDKTALSIQLQLKTIMANVGTLTGQMQAFAQTYDGRGIPVPDAPSLDVITAQLLAVSQKQATDEVTVAANKATITSLQGTIQAQAQTLSAAQAALTTAQSTVAQQGTALAALQSTYQSLQTQVATLVAAQPVITPPPPPQPPPPPPPPVITTPAPIGSALATMYDGPTGISVWGWNPGANVWWWNKFGDYTDASGTLQGSVPRATFSTADHLSWSADLTAQAQAWIDGTLDNGLYLKGQGSAWIGARTNSAGRPELRIDGTLYTPTANNSLSGGSDSPVTLDTNLQLSDTMPVLMQWDLRALAGRKIGNATCNIRAWQTGLQAINAFNIRIPPVHFDPQPASVENWGKRGDFIVKGDGANLNALPEGQVAGDTVYGTDPVMGGTAQFIVRPGQYEPVAKEWRFSAHGQTAPKHLYVASVMRFDTRSTYYQGQKLGLGISGRYGYINDSGTYTPVDGNGGNPTDGYYHPAGTGPNSPGGRAYISGFSMRPWRAQLPYLPGPDAPIGVDPGNPMLDTHSMSTYAYHIPQSNTPYGDNFLWNAILLTGKPYFFLHFVQMNTVLAPDANGNGRGQNDGIYRVWIGNTLVYERTDLCFTHNAGVGCDEVWLDIYEGGTLDPKEVTKTTLGMFAASLNPILPPDTFTVATQPITNTTINPAWKAGKALNTWTQIPGTALINADMTAVNALGYAGGNYGSPNDRLMDYSGGTAVIAGKQQVSGGGGAGANAANLFWEIDYFADSPRWSLKWAPCPAFQVPERDGTGATLRWTNFDGSPIAIHSYKGVWHWNGKSYYVLQQNGWVYDGGRTGDVWCRDSTGWAKVATFADRGGGGWDGPGQCQGADGKIYVALGTKIEFFDPNTNAIGTFWNDTYGYGSLDQAVLTIMAGKLYTLGAHGSDGRTWLLAIDMATGAATRTFVPAFPDCSPWKLNGSLENDGTSLYGFIDDGHVYKIGPDGSSVPLGVAGNGPVAGHSEAKHGDGPKTRFRYVPELGGLVVPQASDVDVYFLPLK